MNNRPTAVSAPMLQADNYHPQTGQLFRRCVGPSAVHRSILSYTYSYDGWGNVKSQEESVAAPGRQETFVRDPPLLAADPEASQRLSEPAGAAELP